MKLSKRSTAWLGAVITAVVIGWLTMIPGEFLPPSEQTMLGITNIFKTKSPRPTEGFRFVLCWLEDDNTSGQNTKIVEQAFSGIEGVELIRDEDIVKASGAANKWRGEMREGARKVLNRWNGDLAIVGLVKVPGKTLSLWFVPREGDGTLRRADQPYELKNVTLQEEFHEDLRAQLVAVALSAVAPLTDRGMRNQVLKKGLTDATEKLTILLEGDTITKSERRAALSLAQGTALMALGQRESERERLEQAVAAYTEGLKEYTREDAPLTWAMTQNNLGLALRTLGERENRPERLEQAVAALNEGLKQFPQEEMPFRWGMMQNNFGTTLHALGKRERNPERLEEAIIAYTEALKVYTREDAPLPWAMMQNNLGHALRTLGEWESSPERLEEAVAAHNKALKEYTRERVPLQWARTQNNLGNALVAMGKRESGRESLKQAVGAYNEALKEYTQERRPHEWVGRRTMSASPLQSWVSERAERRA